MNLLMCAILAATTVFRLELTDETPFIVGADGVKREVVILSPDDYQVLTDRLERVWTSMNSTDDGRSKLHGKRTARVVKDNGIQFTYSDGFTYFEKGHAKSYGQIRATVVTNRVRNATIPTKPNGISSRQWMMRKKREAILKGEVKEVTVEHDALTGKDIVK